MGSFVPPHRKNMGGASGRLRTDLRGGLAALTGLDYHPNHTLWQNWWEADGDQFEVPETGRTLSAALPMALADLLAAAQDVVATATNTPLVPGTYELTCPMEGWRRWWLPWR